MSRKISHSLVSGRAGAGTTGGQGLKIDWFKTNLGRLLWRDVSESVLEWYLGGTNYGYCAGGYNHPGGPTNVIDKWSLSSDANATDVGDLIASNGNNQKVGNSSTTHGYASAGIRAGVEWYDIIQKWTFASDANAADVANLGAGRSGPAGADSADYGFVQGGKESGDTRVNKIEKFTFASDSNATDVGDITVAREQASGCSTATHGYCVGGYASGESDVIDKFISRDVLDSYFKFCIIRNPYNKLYSAWNFIKERHGYSNVNDFIKYKLNEEFIKLIKLEIKSNLSPKHVPSKIFQVLEIPKTKSGKIVELAIKKIINGLEIENKNVLVNPDCLKEYQNIYHYLNKG